MSVVLSKSTNFTGDKTLSNSWSFFLVLPWCKYSVLSNKLTFSAWFCMNLRIHKGRCPRTTEHEVPHLLSSQKIKIKYFTNSNNYLPALLYTILLKISLILLICACGILFYHIMLIKFMKEEEDNISSLKKCIYYGLGVLTTIFLNFMSHFNSTYTNTFNTYSKSTEFSVQV